MTENKSDIGNFGSLCLNLFTFRSFRKVLEPFG